MWCRNCQQDVPAIATPNEPQSRCAKCQRPFSAAEQAVVTATTSAVNAATAAQHEPARDGTLAKHLLDDWDWDEEWEDATRILDSVRSRAPQGSLRRYDSAHLADGVAMPEQRAMPPSRQPSRRPSPRTSFMSWLMLSLGLMAFVFGGVLLGWSFHTGREELWRLGMPFTLGGQAALILGLVFQLDVLARGSREAQTAMEELDTQIAELRRTTTLLSSTHSNPSQAFYFHMAEGASPNLLLADLKGQLDLLANKLAEQRR